MRTAIQVEPEVLSEPDVLSLRIDVGHGRLRSLQIITVQPLKIREEGVGFVSRWEGNDALVHGKLHGMQEVKRHLSAFRGRSGNRLGRADRILLFLATPDARDTRQNRRCREQSSHYRPPSRRPEPRTRHRVPFRGEVAVEPVLHDERPVHPGLVPYGQPLMLWPPSSRGRSDRDQSANRRYRETHAARHSHRLGGRVAERGATCSI